MTTAPTRFGFDFSARGMCLAYVCHEQVPGMDTPILSARSLRALAGKEVMLGGRSLHFLAREDRPHLPAYVEGGEGRVAPVRDVASGDEYMLKLFMASTVERQRRTDFLCRLGLADLHPTLEAAPRVRILQDLQIEGRRERVDGHITKRVAGATLDAVLEEAPLSMQSRTALAQQLCGVLSAFEACGFVHGDLSLTNLMVDRRATATVGMRVIDFDGFYHPAVASLPAAAVKRGARRGIGHDGYRHAAFGSEGGANALVDSDRAALAALLMELMVIQPSDRATLLEERPSLVDQSQADRRAVRVPPTIRERWPRGATLLETVFNTCRHPKDAPAPADWLQEISTFVGMGSGVSPGVRLRITLPDGTARTLQVSNAVGNFGRLSDALAWLHFEQGESGLRLLGTVPTRMEVSLVENQSRLQSMRAGSALSVVLARGTRLHVAGGSIELD